MVPVSIYDPARWVISDRRYDCFMGRPIDEKILFFTLFCGLLFYQVLFSQLFRLSLETISQTFNRMRQIDF